MQGLARLSRLVPSTQIGTLLPETIPSPKVASRASLMGFLIGAKGLGRDAKQAPQTQEEREFMFYGFNNLEKIY